MVIKTDECVLVPVSKVMLYYTLYYYFVILYYIWQSFNPLQNDKIWDFTKLKVFVNDNKIAISLFHRVENTVEEGENAGNLLL